MTFSVLALTGEAASAAMFGTSPQTDDRPRDRERLGGVEGTIALSDDADEVARVA